MRVPCGISLDTASNRLFQHLLERRSDVPALFIDSGAFSEQAHKPFTSQDWRVKLEKYEVLVRGYGNKCVFVAPDKVGDQDESLNRLNDHRQFLITLMTHSHMIVPLQKGRLTQAQMYAEAVTMFDSRVVAGIPFKKAATTYKEYIDFMESAKPPRVHILGVTPFGPRWRDISVINERFTDTRFTFDGCRIRSIVGQGKPLTLALHARKHLPRSQAMYESLISLPQLFSWTAPAASTHSEQLELFTDRSPTANRYTLGQQLELFTPEMLSLHN